MVEKRKERWNNEAKEVESKSEKRGGERKGRYEIKRV